jgi:hypothetical protein
MKMRLSVLLSLLIGIGGCTINPTTYNFTDSNGSVTRTIMVEKETLYSTPSHNETVTPTPIPIVPPVDSSVKPMATRPPIPTLPTFTEAELNNPDIIESRLVDHIAELRRHIRDYYQELEEHEIRTFEEPSDR